MISGKTRHVVSGIRRWRTQKTGGPEARAPRIGVPSPPSPLCVFASSRETHNYALSNESRPSFPSLRLGVFA